MIDSHADRNDVHPVNESEHSATAPAPQKGKTRLPGPEHGEVTHYAYDPQTYEILCRPGQRLSPRKAQRLQELGIYAYVVKFAE